MKYFASFMMATAIVIGVQNASADAAVSYVGQFGNSGAGQLTNPHAVALYDDTVYVTDTNNHRVKTYDLQGNYLGQWGSGGHGNGQFNTPTGLDAGSDGSIYVEDHFNRRIQKFDASGNYLTQWGSQGDGGNGLFQFPHGTAVSPLSGHVYVSDYRTNLVQRFDADGNFITQWDGTAHPGGALDAPHAVAVAPNGNVYVADYRNHRVQYFDPSGLYLGQFGAFGTGAGQFDGPAGLEITANGLIYVIDRRNDRVQKFNLIGQHLETFGGTGTGPGQLLYPFDIVAAADGTLFVTDRHTHSVHIFNDPDAIISAIPAPLAVVLIPGLLAVMGLRRRFALRFASPSAASVFRAWTARAVLLNMLQTWLPEARHMKQAASHVSVPGIHFTVALVFLVIAPAASRGASVVADSIADYSTGQQGSVNGWHYGYYDGDAGVGSYRPADFEPLLHVRADSNNWVRTPMYPNDPGKIPPASWTTVALGGQHPNSADVVDFPEEQHAVRRWVSTVTGAIGIIGLVYDANVNVAGGGDGVIARIFHNDALLWERTVLEGQSDTTPGYDPSFEIDTTIGLGDTLDFVVAPNGNAKFDSTHFPVQMLTPTTAVPGPVAATGGFMGAIALVTQRKSR